MPLPDFLSDLKYGQNNLKKICSERPLDWSEYHHMNHFHGNQAIFSEYAGLNPSQPLPVGIEHAIPYDLEEAYAYDVNSGLNTFLAVHKKSAELYRDKGVEHAIPVGFSYLYALELYQQRHSSLDTQSRQGTLFFPDKSTLLMETDFDRNALAQRLISLAEAYQPVVVCIYWKDYVRGTHQPFLDAGLPVVSAGHIMDAEFQLRLHDLCRHFKYSGANDLAGSFTMSVLSGCQFFHLNSGPLTQRKNGTTEIFQQDPSLSRPVKQSCILASPFPPANPVRQQQLALENSGSTFKRSPSELKDIIMNARLALSRKHQVHSMKMSTGTTRTKLYSLLPSGIDRDGWSRKESEITIPRKTGSNTLVFQIEIPSWSECESLSLIYGCHDGAPERLHLNTGYHKITIMHPNPDGKNWHIHFSSNRDTQLPDQPRRRSFRILSFDQS